MLVVPWEVHRLMFSVKRAPRWYFRHLFPSVSILSRKLWQKCYFFSNWNSLTYCFPHRLIVRTFLNVVGEQFCSCFCLRLLKHGDQFPGEFLERKLLDALEWDTYPLSVLLNCACWTVFSFSWNNLTSFSMREKDRLHLILLKNSLSVPAFASTRVYVSHKGAVH